MDQLGTEKAEPAAGAQMSAPRPEDFVALFREQAPFVWRTLRYLGVPPSELEDVCQEVFVVVHRKLDTFEGRSAVRTWLYGICRNVAWNHRDKAYRRREIATDRPPETLLPALQLERIEQEEARTLLSELLETLDEPQRTVFVLYQIEQMPMAEIVEAIQCPLQTGYSRLHAAREMLKKRLRARMGREESKP